MPYSTRRTTSVSTSTRLSFPPSSLCGLGGRTDYDSVLWELLEETAVRTGFEVEVEGGGEAREGEEGEEEREAHSRGRDCFGRRRVVV
jgi:hypothetical protein